MLFDNLKLYIGGELVDATDGETHPIICPGNEEKVVNGKMQKAPFVY